MQRSSTPASVANIQWIQWISQNEVLWNINEMLWHEMSILLAPDRMHYQFDAKRSQPLKNVGSKSHRVRLRPLSITDMSALRNCQNLDHCSSANDTTSSSTPMSHFFTSIASKIRVLITSCKGKRVRPKWKMEKWRSDKIRCVVFSAFCRCRGATLAASRRARRPADCGRPLREANTKLGSTECSETKRYVDVRRGRRKTKEKIHMFT